MSALDLRTIALRGMHLVEASAGTGKTWSIVRLYLRLLLVDVAGQEPLTVDRIVVVTYTVAATEELRGRIRELLRQGLDHLEGRKPLDDGDQVTVELLGRCPDTEKAIARLNAALVCLDEARISTIHGYCLHALKDNAFESGSPFDPELQPEEADLRRQAMEDFWRKTVAVLPAPEAKRLRAMWHSPAVLLDALNGILGREGLCLVPENARAELVEQEKALRGLFTRLCALWPKEREAVAGLLSSSALSKTSYKPAIITRALHMLDALVANEGYPAALDKDFVYLTPDKLAAATKKNCATPSHSCFDLCGRIAEVFPTVARLGRAAWLTRAREFCRAWLEHRKNTEERLHYDDLLSRLAQALEGARGDTLARVLRQQAPVALIDEFQDTDPLQWKIFRRIYQGQPDCGLYLIGDPKQAIYAFRGADIFSYIQARQAISAANRHTLLTNWRAHSRLVDAVNHLFLRVDTPFVYAEIPFEPAAAGGNADQDDKALTLDGAVVAPMRLRLLEPAEGGQPPGVIEARQQAARACAEDIARLLALGEAGRARLGKKQLAAGDIGVLVRSHHEGSLVQQALGVRGIASVSLSRDSVFATDEARDLALLLAALVESRDESLLRAALATPLMGRTVGELRALAEDEAAWAGVRERQLELRERWQRQGFMSAFFALLHDEEIPARLRRLPDGERRLTNVLQLGELLQEQSLRQGGPEGLLRWFTTQRAALSRENEAQQLRLENDEQLVRIITIHKSKGLQYPVVFLPFFALRRNNNTKDDILLYHEEESHKACADLGSKELETHRQLARQEGLAEEMRLLYVAVTRAEQLCVLTWGKVKEAEQTAPACLLHPGEVFRGQDRNSREFRILSPEYLSSRMADLDAVAVRQEVLALARESAGAIALIEDEAESVWIEQATFAASSRKEAPMPTARVFRGSIRRGWQAMSYTRLAHGSEMERPESPAVTAEAPATAEDEVFGLSGGVQLGNLLHTALEVFDFSSVEEAALREVLRPLFPRFSLDASLEDTLVRLLRRALQTPLDAENHLALCSLARQDTLRELRFNFSASRIDPAALRRVLADDPACERAAFGLRFEQFYGLMTGSIDLLFRARGRFFIADYKSNHLGNLWSDYGAAGLQRAMDAHRYALQCLMYTVALHRYLRGRLTDYDYDRHVGGAYYLFLRGMHPERGPGAGVWHWRPPLALVERLDRLFAGGEGA
ncbi:MAG: exodeoxyribonuclease V subunit beta [Desulfobulbaceae bacterium A2]|nr:MAG: exodeoxyribonuclease V subunit beta [Desulfobulbaceae bacterium A2]